MFVVSITIFLVGLRAVRRRAVDGPAHRVPRAAGHRRRRPAAALAGRDRRPLLPARARALPGLHRRRCGRPRRSPARCWAARSPTPRRGAGSSSSTCRSARSRSSSSMRTMHAPAAVRAAPDRLSRARSCSASRSPCLLLACAWGGDDLPVGLGRGARHRRRGRRPGSSPSSRSSGAWPSRCCRSTLFRDRIFAVSTAARLRRRRDHLRRLDLRAGLRPRACSADSATSSGVVLIPLSLGWVAAAIDDRPAHLAHRPLPRRSRSSGACSSSAGSRC